MTSSQTILAAALAQLVAVLPGLVAAQSLPAALEFLDYEPDANLGLLVSKAPQVWVSLEGDSRSGEAGRGATLHKYSHNLTLAVGVTAAAADPSAANARLYGYADVIRDCMESKQALSPGVLWVRWMRTDYTPPIKESTRMYREALLTFDINRRTRIGED